MTAEKDAEALEAADHKWLAILFEDGARFLAEDSQRRLLSAGLIRIDEQTGRARLSPKGRLFAHDAATGGGEP